MSGDTKVMVKASTSRRQSNSQRRKADHQIPKVMLKSSDRQVLEAEVSVVCQSQVIKDMIENMGTRATTSPIILHNISSKILAKVMEYCTYHERSQRSSNGSQTLCERDIERLDGEFVKVDLETLGLILEAADYLHIESLMDLTCQAIADTIKGKSIREMRKIFGIQNDFSPEEEDKLMRKFGRLMGVPRVALLQ